MGISLSGQDSESEYSKSTVIHTHDAVFAIAPSSPLDDDKGQEVSLHVTAGTEEHR